MKYIGETNEDYTHGEEYAMMKKPMLGKIYEPGKGPDGQWFDKIGKPDDRLMLWKDRFAPKERTGYKVYTPEELAKNWE